MTSPVHVTSEIGTLKTVLLKRPGKEVENLTPDIMGRLLFDDIPYLPEIQREHDFSQKRCKTMALKQFILKHWLQKL